MSEIPSAEASVARADLAVLLEKVTKTFGKHEAVKELSLNVPRGSIYGFIGPNGSGKTTTIRMILHIFHPDSGEVEVLGNQSTRSANDRIGYLPEERGLYRKQKVNRVLQYFGALKGMSRRDANASINHWLERMGLSEWAHKKVEALSKGMAQKIQFVSAVMADPELIILDEPFSGLDPVNLKVIRDAILDLRQQGRTIIFSTHDMSMAERMCDSIFMIYKGRKVLDGSMHEIQSAHGEDRYRLGAEGSLDFVREIDGVSDAKEINGHMELKYVGESQKLLRAVMDKTPVTHFEVAKPSLHDIFVRIARPTTEEAAHGKN
ncbi:MAG: ABC transporter [Verrucomicrobiales bacterium]|nr:ABC transporter [Verrucomicrobiales bacterium]